MDSYSTDELLSSVESYSLMTDPCIDQTQPDPHLSQPSSFQCVLLNEDLTMSARLMSFFILLRTPMASTIRTLTGWRVMEDLPPSVLTWEQWEEHLAPWQAEGQVRIFQHQVRLWDNLRVFLYLPGQAAGQLQGALILIFNCTYQTDFVYGNIQGFINITQRAGHNWHLITPTRQMSQA